jgi:hypothetical protein
VAVAGRAVEERRPAAERGLDRIEQRAEVPLGAVHAPAGRGAAARALGQHDLEHGRQRVLDGVAAAPSPASWLRTTARMGT